jgi:hypothetical protein
MLNFILPLLKNPITQFIASKTVGAIQHKLEMDKLIRAKEIEASKDVSIQQVVSSEKSWKDEWLTVYTTLIVTACFIPQIQPFISKGFEILKSAPNEILWAILIVYSGSFGLNVMDKFKK